MTSGNDGWGRRKVGRSLRVISGLGDPQFNQTLREKELTGDLTTRNPLRSHEFINSPLADAQIVRNLCDSHQVRDRVHTRIRVSAREVIAFGYGPHNIYINSIVNVKIA